MKRLLFNVKLSKILCLLIVACNLILPWKKGVFVQFNIFNIVAAILWVYALISQMGYFLVQVSEDENGHYTYENRIPIVQIVVDRVLEILFYLFFKKGVVDWRFIIALIAMDLIYMLFLLMDKSNYYYESEVMEVSENEFSKSK